MSLKACISAKSSADRFFRASYTPVTCDVGIETNVRRAVFFSANLLRVRAVRSQRQYQFAVERQLRHAANRARDPGSVAIPVQNRHVMKAIVLHVSN